MVRPCAQRFVVVAKLELADSPTTFTCCRTIAAASLLHPGRFSWIPCLPKPHSASLPPLGLSPRGEGLRLRVDSMESITGYFTGKTKEADIKVEFWNNPERCGWLMKQGEFIKTWRRRWFVLKQGRIFWFKEQHITPYSKSRGVIPVSSCLTVKGAEDVLNKQFAFELSTNRDTMYFIADTDKEKEDWINAIGRSIVRHSRSVTDEEVLDYDSKRAS